MWAARIVLACVVLWAFAVRAQVVGPGTATGGNTFGTAATAQNKGVVCFSSDSGQSGETCNNSAKFASPYPKRRAWFPARSGECEASGCTAPATTTTGDNSVMFGAAAFADAATQCWQVDAQLPDSYVSGTPFNVAASWYPDDDTTSGSVVWQLKMLAVGDDEVIDAAFGDAVTVTDAWSAAEKLHVSADSGDITAAGTPAQGDHIWVQVCRLGSDAGDTLAGGASDNANLIGIHLILAVDAFSTED